MIRKFIVLGCATIAVVAASAMAASVALAGELTADEYPAVLDGKNIAGKTNAYTGLSQTVECEETSYSGSIAKAAAEITITPAYAKCKSGSRPVTVTVNECDFNFHGLAGANDVWTVETDIKCPPKKLVEIHIYENAEHKAVWCTLTVGAQTNLKGLSALNETGAKAVDDTIKFEGAVEKVVTETHGTCSAGLTFTFEGKIDTNATITGTNVLGSPNGLRID